MPRNHRRYRQEAPRLAVGCAAHALVVDGLVVIGSPARFFVYQQKMFKVLNAVVAISG